MSTGSANNSLDRYQAILAEAERIRGVSLWQDAWRRLKRNRAAMGSLGFLIVLALLTFFTPLLPLQSPQVQDLRNRKFLTPTFASHELEIDLEKVALAEREIAEARELRRRVVAEQERKAADEQLAAKIKAHPFNNLWTSPGPFTKFLIRTRLAIFGRWCIPSICGTDALGRDVLARIFWGARISLIVGIVATAVSLVIGVSYGATAGYVGGWYDTIVMRIVDVLYSIPFIFVVIFLITFLSEEHIKAQLASVGINQLIIFYFVIGAIYWLTMARVVRGQVISLKNEQFVDAARTIGAGTPRIIFRHLVPNVMGIVIVYLTLTIPSIILFEAFLSFLGLGVTPPDVSWGILVSDAILVISGLKIYWWLVLFPGLVFTMTLFSLNFLGDGLRDALDPKMKNR
jgi:oligopeptide transport system permease protein